jgi:hypothetical protein
MKVFRSLFFGLCIALSLAAIVFIIVRWVPVGRYPGDPFFDLAAQTIPILLVALAVEAQARRFDLEIVGKRIRIVAVILLACGETAAIAVSAALYIPERGTVASDVFVVITAVGLLGGFFAVIAVALRTPTTPLPSAAGDREVQEPTQEARPAVTPQSGEMVQASQNQQRAFSAFAGILLGTILLSVIRRDGGLG